MRGPFGTIIKILILVAIVAVIAYFATCAYANLVAFQYDGMPKLPSVSKASHSFRIMNTGNTLMSSDYEQQGDIYILHGYWEQVKDKYEYRKGVIILDKKIFGEIRVTERR